MPAKPLFCAQTLPSTCENCGLTMLTCAASMFCSGGSVQNLNCSLLRSNLTMVAWYMLPSQRSPALSCRKPRKPVGNSGLVHRNGIFLVRAGLRVEPAQELLAEARVPGDAVGIDDHVVRLDGLAPEVILGDDDAGGAALGTRQRLELVLPLRAGAQVDAAEEVGGAAVDLNPLVAALLHAPLTLAQLRVRRDALVHVALHARQRDIDEFVGGVGGARDALDRVAADAAQHGVLLLVGAREAREPFAVRHLRGEIFGLAQLEVEVRRLLRGDLDRGRAVEIVADGPDADRVLARLELARREGVAAGGVADHRHGDRRAGLLGADQHALHRAFLGGGDLSGQGLGLRRADADCERKTGGD